jgi:hypothetical protein
MSSFRLVAIAGLALVCAGACTSLLGDDFEVAGTTSATATGTGGSAGSGGTGGSATGTPSGTGGSPTGTPTGSGGGGGGCVLGTEEGCDPDFKCSVIDVNTGATGCVGAGERPAWSSCQSDSQCQTGTWCDLLLGVCKPLCPNTGCDNNGECLPAEHGNGTIPDLFVCTANCEPDQATPCVQDYGPVTCGRVGGGWDCQQSGNGGTGSSCGDDGDCAPGLLCTAQGACWEWCLIGQGGTCTTGTGTYCSAVVPPANHDNGEYGVCTIG